MDHMKKKIGFITVKPEGRNIELIEGAIGGQNEAGIITVRPITSDKKWRQPYPAYPDRCDIRGLIEGTLNKLIVTARCTVTPSDDNNWTATFQP
jgi:hypothetical protein